jgi:CheY-like chemotaxis protein
MNLAVNARDAMRVGGKLIISSTNLEIDHNKVSRWAGLPSGKYVLLTVADTGSGMTEDVRSHIFEPFFTTKSPGEGTGLGLSTVYGIVQQSHGHIFVDTAPGQGATFSLLFPAVEAAPVVTESSPKPFLKGGCETILLVEDQYDVRVLSAKTLRQLGYKVCEAENSDHALELAQQSCSHFDLLLTDIVMPRMNGIELARRIQSIQSGIKILYMSGYMGDTQSDQDQPGARRVYLQKPFVPEGLAAKVREALDGTE